MRILFIHEVNYLAKPIFEMHEFPEHLARNGHDIAFWHFPEGQTLKDNIADGWKRRIRGRVLDTERITLYSFPFVAGNFLGRLFTASMARLWTQRICQDFQPDVVVCLSVPTQGWQAVQVAKSLGIPFVFRALDVSHLIRKTPFWHLVRIAERYIYRKSDFISANNQAMLSYCSLERRSGNQKTQVHFPPLDLKKFSVGNRNRGRELLGLGVEDKVVMYMGSFFYFSGLNGVIRDFLSNRTDEKLVLVGGGEQEDELKKLCVDLGGQGAVFFPGYVSFDDLPDILKAADVAINPMEKSLVSDVALPNKVLQYLAAGIPTVSTPLKGLQTTLGNLPGLSWGSNAGDIANRALSIIREQGEHQYVVSTDQLLDLFAHPVRDFESSLTDLIRKK